MSNDGVAVRPLILTGATSPAEGVRAEIASSSRSPDEAIRLCVVNDQPILRESVAELLETYKEFKVVGRCAVADGSHHILSYGHLDFVLVHFGADRQRIFTLLKQLGPLKDKSRIVVVAGGLSRSDVLRLVSHQVSGILSDAASPEQLVKCIRKVTAGELWFDQPQLRVIITASVDVLKKIYDEPFTDREKSLIRGLIDGLSNKEIASCAALEESAVKGAFHRIYKKMGVHTRAQLVRLVLAHFGDEI